MERLLRQCEAALEVQRNNTSRISAEKWAEHFRNTLAAFEFPAEFGGSHQFQTFDRWQQLLDEFATLSLSGERYSVRDALQRLSGMAAEAIFQPESTDTPVTIMGPLEAAGSLFDGIFFLGCTDERWPIPQTINPLLPAALQQALHMPGAVRGESQEQGRQMTQRIVRSAGEVIFSHAQQNSDGEVRPSPILREIADISPAEILADLHRAADQPAFLLREYADETPSRWTAARGTVASGLLRSQAACPFQAFALHRLRARGEDIAEEGFDNLQRGQLLHKLLQEVWTGDGGLVTSAALHATIDNGTLEAFVREKAATVLRDASAGGWEREYLAIERERLSGLVCGWLHDVEARRSPFRVLETEREHTFALLDELNFKVRLDRVDEALDVSGEGTGETILLDYKSGKVNNKAWHVENNLHMDEPQMPLYALYALRDADGNITPPAALAFASLHSENGPCLQGVSARPGLLPPSKKDPANRDALDGLLEKWQQDIENVAWEFVTGDAQVKPKHGAKTCEHCDLQPLCRVHTQQALLEDADEAEDADGLAEAGAE
jgi:probable DNA repair protein